MGLFHAPPFGRAYVFNELLLDWSPYHGRSREGPVSSREPSYLKNSAAPSFYLFFRIIFLHTKGHLFINSVSDRVHCSGLAGAEALILKLLAFCGYQQAAPPNLADCFVLPGGLQEISTSDPSLRCWNPPYIPGCLSLLCGLCKPRKELIL